MKRITCVFILIVVCIVNVPAQLAAETSVIQNRQIDFKPKAEGTAKSVDYQWEFSMPGIDNKLIGDVVSSNYRLGEKNARLKDYVNDTYTSTEPITPGNPMTRIIIRKPAIFNAVKAIEKYYLSGIRKNEVSQNDAINDFSHVLHVAVAAASENSTSFEEALQVKRKDVRQLIGLFNQVKLRQM